MLKLSIGLDIVLEEPGLGAPQEVLGVPVLGQKQTQWCWAACKQMVFRFSDSVSTTEQCELANAAFELMGCCNSPTSSLCNKPLSILRISGEWQRWGYRSSYRAESLEFASIKFEIDHGRPIECGLKWHLGGGHAVLIIGYIDDPISPDVIVNDPWELQKTIKYSELVTAYGRGQWSWAWTDIFKQ